MNKPTLQLAPRRAAVLAGHDSVLDVLVRIQAPELSPEEQALRAQLQLAIVIDRSGSMTGAPLHEAKRCAEFVVNSLASSDAASVVVYDNEVETLAPLTPVLPRERLLRAIRGVSSRGSTNLHGGWFAGAETLAPHTRPEAVSRVILLSDGCANHGLTNPALVQRECAELAEAGVTTSTYGLGHHFNEELMIGMARAGGGNSYYGNTAEDLMDPFREELSLLTALVARRLVLQVNVPEGVQVEMLNGYRGDAASGWSLPDLAAGGEAWAVLRFTVPASLAVQGADLSVVKARVAYQDVEGTAQPGLDAELRVPALPAAAFSVLSEDDLVARRVRELESASIEEQARKAALERNWSEVEHCIVAMDVLAEDSPWLQGTAQRLRELAKQQDRMAFSKEAAFSSQRKRSRLAEVYESAQDFDSAEAPARDVPDYLRRKLEQGRRTRR